MNDTLTQGLTLMAIGMGVVFVFLILMVGVMKATACFFARFGHRFAGEPEPGSHLKALAADDGVEIAVAMAAIHHYNREQ